MGIQVFFWAGKFPIFHSQSWAGKLPVGQVRQKIFAPSWARKTCDTVFCTVCNFSDNALGIVVHWGRKCVKPSAFVASADHPLGDQIDVNA